MGLGNAQERTKEKMVLISSQGWNPCGFGRRPRRNKGWKGIFLHSSGENSNCKVGKIAEERAVC